MRPGNCTDHSPRAGTARAGVNRRATCEERGGFETTSVRRGGYCAIALDRPLGLEEMFFGFDFDQGLVDQSAKGEIRPGEATSVDLRVTIRP